MALLYNFTVGADNILWMQVIADQASTAPAVRPALSTTSYNNHIRGSRASRRRTTAGNRRRYPNNLVPCSNGHSDPGEE